MEEMQKLLTKLKFSQTYFDNGKLVQIKCNKEKTSFEFFIEVDSITYKKYIEFIKRLKGYYPLYNIKVNINIINKDINNIFFELYNEYLKNITLNQYKDYKVEIKDDNICIECANDFEKNTLENIIKEIKDKISILGYNIKPNVTVNKDLQNKIEAQIQSDLYIDYSRYNEPVEMVKEEQTFNKYPRREPRDKTLVVDEVDGVIKGRKIEGDITLLKDIKETDRAIIEVKIFSTEVITTKTELKIITLKMTDNTDSIYGKIFVRDEDDLNSILKAINNKSWYKITGQVKYDEYAKELSILIRDINLSDKTDTSKKDTASEKRIELHAHTMMSQMDGVIDEVTLVKTAMKYGHRALAITDHDSCQAFPHVYSEICKYNSNLESPIKSQIKELEALEQTEETIKKIEELKTEKANLPYFKGLYGVELEMTDEDLNIIYNAKDIKTDDLTYVVFDTETTGFNPGLHDQMIEIGAVKMYKGEVVERFDELINPGRKLDAVITNLTGITDNKLKDADTEENVTRRFKEWIGDLPLVAHNATFDKNMLDMAYYKYNLGKLENPVIDTLMLSRVINSDLKRHSLTALSKHYGMNFAEEDDEDSEESNNFGSTIVTTVNDVLINDNSIYNRETEELSVYSTEEETKINIKVIFRDGKNKEINTEIKPGLNTINVDNKLTIMINKIRSHHRADYDAENTGYIFVKMLEQIKGLKNLDEFLNPGYIEALAGIKPVKYMTDYDNIPKQTRTQELTNNNQKTKHITLIAQTREGLKNIFKLISYANTGFIAKSSRIPRRIVEQNRKDVLVGSACLNGEIFNIALTRSEEDLKEAMKFYDYIEVQPPNNYIHLVKSHDLSNYDELIYALNKIIKCAKEENKLICATSDAHTLNKEDKIYREIIINQNVPGKGRHALARYLKKDNKGTNKNMDIINDFIKNSKEMYGYELDNVTINTLKLIGALDNIEEISSDFDTICELYTFTKEEILKLGKDFEKNKRENLHDAIRTLMSEKAIIEDKGEYHINASLILDETKEEPHIPDEFFRTTDEMLEEFSFLDEKTGKEIVIENPSKVADKVEYNIEVIIATDKPFSPIIEDSEKTTRDMVYNKAYSIYGNPLPENIEKRIEDELRGIIGGGFDVIYLIAQKLVKHSNDDGYIVGSRGSVGSSFVATMMGITEVNSLPAHYVCPNCKHSIFEIDGKALGAEYSSGFDLPDMNCPKCSTLMHKEGNDMPFATFLGFNADKVPDIDLNFSGDNQASAHEYTKVLFGTDNVYRAGTIGTVADKTAFGFVQGFYEDKIYDTLRVEANSYNIKIPSKDELKKKKIIRCTRRTPEVERIALGCTGVKRTTGQHPGGIVVVPGYKEVFDFTPFQYPADDPTVPWRTTHFDYHAIDQDLLKLDILGHDDPTVLRMLQDLSKEEVRKGKEGLETFVDPTNLPRDEEGNVDVTKVPLGDKATMEIFSGPEVLGVSKEQIMCETGTLGIPEFGTKFVIQMLVDTKPKTFAELIKISGLSHGTDVWLGNAQDLIRNNIVPFKEVIGCRDDIMVYLRYHGMKDLDAFKIMEFVRKGKASKEPDKWVDFKNKMKEAGIEEWFIDSCNKIKYMFPKAHATAYVTSAFRIAWYKVHYPILYYCAYMSIRCADFDVSAMVNGYNAIKNRILDIEEKGSSASNKESNVYDVMQIALEASARGIKFAQIDIEKSDSKYFKILDKDTLLLPFRCLDGLGDSVAQKIVIEREKRPFYSIEDLQKRGGVSKTLIEKMKELGVLDDMDESNQLSLF